MKKIIFLMFLSVGLWAQSDLEKLQTSLESDELLKEDLHELCDEIGGRVTGSKANEASVEWAYKKKH